MVKDCLYIILAPCKFALKIKSDLFNNCLTQFLDDENLLIMGWLPAMDTVTISWGL